MAHRATVGVCLLLLLVAGCVCRLPEPAVSAGSPAVERQLTVAGTNALELSRALSGSTGKERVAMQFLVEHMPEKDVRELSAAFLLENVRLAREAVASAPWGAAIPADIYLNDVLPYASLTEAREPWRAKLREISLPLIADCRTPGEAAQRLNEKLFKLLKVRYSTGRKRPDQAPSETMASGVATCTGLSILLVDACRSVGVPARVVGTPMWSNMRGNHTWVEVWDDGWQFTGAAEADKNGLNRGWFVHDASEARADVPRHAIYATSFRKSEVGFPMVWAPDVTWVGAVNVTEHYAAKPKAAADARPRLLVKVLDAPAGRRVAVPITVTELNNTAAGQSETSRGEAADLNDFAAFPVLAGGRYRVELKTEGRPVKREITFGTNASELVTLTLTDQPVIVQPSMVCYIPQKIQRPLSAGDAWGLKSALNDYFRSAPDARGAFQFEQRFNSLLRDNEPAVRRIAWETYLALPAHQAARADFDASRVGSGKHVSPYVVKTVGTRPTNGWALFIAMHGGGGAPPEVNDSQWKIMQRYYKDHPEAGGYLYLALRAPNDTWNGFYDRYVYPLVDRLVDNFFLFGDVDPNKVFIMGYSHGGYGAYAIGPKMPDHFAAIHASAAAATQGETTPVTLRNTVFSAMVGEKDTMYGRLTRNRSFAEEVEKLRGKRTDIYPVTIDIKEGFGHGGLPDRDLIPQLYPAVRNPVPRELSWLMTDDVVQDFYWLQVPKPGKKQEILASCRDNRFVITANSDVASATVFFDSRLVDFSQPIQIELNGATTTRNYAPDLGTLCRTLLDRGDAELAFTSSFVVVKDPESGRLSVSAGR